MGFLSKLWRKDGPRDAVQPPESGATASPSNEAPIAQASLSTALPAEARRRTLLIVGSEGQISEAADPGLSLRPETWATIPIGREQVLDLVKSEQADEVLFARGSCDGASLGLINHLGQDHPRLLRFLWNPPADEEFRRRLMNPPPVFLANDLDPQELDEVLTRAFLVEDLIVNDSIRKLLPKIRVLPTLPDIYSKIVSELRSPDASMEVIAGLISNDPIITAKILHVVNSVEVGLSRTVSSAFEAILLLGAERVAALVLVARLFTELSANTCPKLDWPSEWNHSMQVGWLARRLMERQVRDARAADLAFTAGVLHDIGRFLLAANFPTHYEVVLEQGKLLGDLLQAEVDLFEVTHAQFGAVVLGKWGLPFPIIEAVAWHHAPSQSKSRAFGPLAAVHAANHLVRERQKSGSQATFDPHYFKDLGMPDYIEDWRREDQIKSGS
jgi:HD-like signal output (HDOD) protein